MGLSEEPRPARFHPPRCVRCFHTLVGLPERGACPECGTAFDGESRWDWVERVAEPGWRGVAWHFLPLGIGLVVLVLAAIRVVDTSSEELWVSVAVWTAMAMLVVTFAHSTIRSFRRISMLHRIRVEDGVATPRDAIWRWVIPPLVGLVMTALAFVAWSVSCFGCFMPRTNW